jgi:hypothetical protein
LPYYQGNGGWGVDNAENAKNLSFTVSGLGGSTFTLSELSFEERATGQGPSTITVEINGVVVFSDDVPDSETRLQTIDLSTFTQFEEIAEAEVVIKGWDNDSRDTNGSGQWRLNGIILEGEIQQGSEPVLTAEPGSLQFAYPEGQGPSEVQAVSVEGFNLDGTELTAQVSGNFEVSAAQEGPFGPSVSLGSVTEIDQQLFVRMEEGLDIDDYSGSITISGGGAPEVLISLSGDVVVPFEIPYSNPFNPQSLAELAISQGFVLSNVNLSNDRVDIFINGFVQTPSIDFSLYQFLEVEYDLASFGAGSNRVLSLLISNDGGDTFTEIFSTAVPPGASPYNTTTVMVDLEGNDAVDGRLRMQMTGGTGGIRFRDFSIDPVFTTTVSGPAGWRLLSLPVDLAPVSALAVQNQIQGVEGLNDLYDDENYDEADPNFWVYRDLGDDPEDGWQAPSSVDTQILSVEGFAWFFFDNSIGQSVPLPFNLSVSGAPVTEEQFTNLNFNQQFNLLGNPYAETMTDLDLGDDVQSDLSVWNPVTETYEFAAEIPPFTGFFAEAANPGGFAVFPVPGGGNGSKPAAEVIAGRLDLTLEGTLPDGRTVTDRAVRLSLHESATGGWDRYDLSKLTPMSHTYALLSFVGERSGEEVLQSVMSQPYELQQTLELPLRFDAVNAAGAFTISAEGIALPEGLEITLLDNETGERTDLLTDAYTFTYDAEMPAYLPEAHILPAKAGTALRSSGTDARFTVIVDPQPLSGPVQGELPRELALNQNYPNPFNPTTQIRYELPETADVRLDVFNIQGQRVSTLVSASQSAGVYNITFDASALASGVYIYRLQAGNTVLTRKMTLIK